MKALVAVALLCALCPKLQSQSTVTTPITPSRIKIYFECQCDDDAAAQFASAFRDIIAASPRYVMADAAEEKVAGEKYPRIYWHLKIVSLDTTSDNSGAATALSEVLLLGDNYYMTQSVQFCGRSKAAECAKTAFAILDKNINK